MIKANVYIDHYGWQKKLKDPKKYVNKKIKKASKIANEFLSVLPRINANGAISISPISIIL